MLTNLSAVEEDRGTPFCGLPPGQGSERGGTPVRAASARCLRGKHNNSRCAQIWMTARWTTTTLDPRDLRLLGRPVRLLTTLFASGTLPFQFGSAHTSRSESPTPGPTACETWNRVHLRFGQSPTPGLVSIDSQRRVNTNSGQLPTCAQAVGDSLRRVNRSSGQFVTLGFAVVDSRRRVNVGSWQSRASSGKREPALLLRRSRVLSQLVSAPRGCTLILRLRLVVK